MGTAQRFVLSVLVGIQNRHGQYFAQDDPTSCVLLSEQAVASGNL